VRIYTAGLYAKEKRKALGSPIVHIWHSAKIKFKIGIYVLHSKQTPKKGPLHLLACSLVWWRGNILAEFL
jgi:hypothetical protein